jgi:SAM-dependent methyltransferase
MAEAAILYAGGAELGAGKARPLTELAHLAEDAIHIRLLMPEGRPKVLDFGMNRGDWAAMSGAFGCEIWGTDIDAAAAVAAKERGVRFVGFDELAPAAFDFINADQVFEHLTDPVTVLSKLERSLRPGGWLKLSTPGDRRMEAKLARARAGGYDEAEWRREFDSLAPLMHVNLFERRSLVALGMEVGLEPYRLPLRIAYAAMVLFHTSRQWNRNLVNPWKRWRGKGTWQYFRKPQG